MSTWSSRAPRAGRRRLAGMLTAGAILLVPPALAADTGFEGRVAIDGRVLPGARVFAYRSFEDFLSHRPAAASAVTGDDGFWTIDAPAGRYYLAAKKLAAGAEDGPVLPGDYLAYHGSNPVSAVAGRHTHVGFSMERLEAGVVYEEGTAAGTGSLAGIVTSAGEPLAGASVVLYAGAEGDFRGQGYAALPPSGGGGAFRADSLPPGDYFVVVRKRAGRKSAGPITDGDYFGFFGANPVRVFAGKVARIRMPAVAKASEIGKDDSLFRDTGTRISGRIADGRGNVVRGVYAFAYAEKAMALKRPVAISREVDASGAYVLNLPGGGLYFVGARTGYGDTPGRGEWYGRYAGTGDHSVRVEAGGERGGIDITVESILP